MAVILSIFFFGGFILVEVFQWTSQGVSWIQKKILGIYCEYIGLQTLQDFLH